MTKRSLKKLSPEAHYELLVAEEDLILEAQMLIQGALNERGLSQKDLAELLGVGQSYVSQMLGLSGRNLTLRTIARVMHALGLTAELRAIDPLEATAPRATSEEAEAEATAGATRLPAALDSTAWGQVLTLPERTSRGAADGDAKSYASYDPAYLLEAA
jgi:transcriptional regulator with XRE-family HTH domain